MKILKTIAIVVTSLILAISASCSKTASEPGTQLKAAIIDQLGSLYPNEQFIQEVSRELENIGYAVTFFKGDQITVDLLQKLPAWGFKLIIFRVHTNVPPRGQLSAGKTFLFTSEPYRQSMYVSQQLSDRIVPARVDENSPQYFAVSSDFLARFSQGKFNQSVIIMMGCASLRSTDMAEAFISRGALIYTGWTASVKLDFVDDFTIDLIKNLCVKDTSFKKAIYQTAQEKGIDPTYHSTFSYYPSENENYSLLGSY
jgi:hypothetical protein